MPTPTPTYSLAQCDAISWLEGLTSDSVDLLITDPPYESLEKHRAVGTTTRLSKSKGSSNPWFAIFPNSRFPQLMEQAFRVLKKNSHFYLFCDSETMFVAKPLGEAAGFKFWKPLVWDKVSIGMGYHYRSRYEVVLFFEKGKRRLRSLSVPDVLSVPRVRGGYPTEKPIELLRVLIEQSSSEGELVADPFMGAGSTLVAAALTGRHSAGADINPEALRVAEARLAMTNARPYGRNIG